jgi:signal transduction histidine kinase
VAQENEPSRSIGWPAQSLTSQIFNDLPYVLVITQGPDHLIQFCNPATFEIFRLGPEILGKPLAEAYPRFAEEGHVETFAHVYKAGEVVSRQEVPLTNPGWGEEVKYFDIVVRPFFDDRRLITGVIGHGVEVTNQVHARQRLEEAVRVRDDFVSVVSHELRNPLNVLAIHLATMKLKLLSSEPNPVAAMGERVAKMEETMESLSGMVDRLLDVSRMVYDRLRLERTEFNLGVLVQQVVDRLSDEAHGCETQINQLGSLSVNWDPKRIDQVMCNLLANAYKYGEGRLVDITLEGLNGVVRLHVRDHGIGICSEDQRRIFERFEQAQPRPRMTFGGFGLGLWICRTIVEAHGGRIWVKSTVGAGSCFTVELPRKRRLVASTSAETARIDTGTVTKNSQT